MKRQDLLKLPGWLLSNVFYRVDMSDEPSENGPRETNRQEVHPLDANLISSQKPNGKHTLMLDLDIRHHYRTSSSGNGHLYIDTDLDRDAIQEILTVLYKHGIVQLGILNQITERGWLSFRPPGVEKGAPIDNMGVDAAKEALNKPMESAKKYFDFHLADEMTQTLIGIGALKDPYKDLYNGGILEQISVPITVFGSQMNEVLKTLMFHLGLSDAEIRKAPKDDLSFYEYETYFQSQGHRIADLDEGFMIFKQEYFETSLMEDVPYNWPTWQQVKLALSPLVKTEPSKKACFTKQGDMLYYNGKKIEALDCRWQEDLWIFWFEGSPGWGHDLSITGEALKDLDPDGLIYEFWKKSKEVK